MHAIKHLTDRDQCPLWEDNHYPARTKNFSDIYDIDNDNDIIEKKEEAYSDYEGLLNLNINLESDSQNFSSKLSNKQSKELFIGCLGTYYDNFHKKEFERKFKNLIEILSTFTPKLRESVIKELSNYKFKDINV